MAPIDLRSDTVTRPTPGMRRAMAEAEVGDDVYGEDPTVNRLQEEVADRFGREAALLVPSGTMANQLWMRVLAPPGSEVVVEADAHLVAFEGGASALHAQVQFRTLEGDRGVLSAPQVRQALRPPLGPYTTNSVIAVENTHNRHGGAVYPLDEVRALRKVADERGLALYMDGARIFNASVASGTPVADYAAQVDGLMFCVSKGLGAPVGSLLVGDEDAIAAAHGWRRRMGGGMRQAGVLAAAGRYALEHHVERLADDHANARRIAALLAEEAPGSTHPNEVATNMVYVDTGSASAREVAGRLRGEGVVVGVLGDRLLRLVTHLDVDREECEQAARRLAAVLAGS